MRKNYYPTIYTRFGRIGSDPHEYDWMTDATNYSKKLQEDIAKQTNINDLFLLLMDIFKVDTVSLSFIQALGEWSISEDYEVKSTKIYSTLITACSAYHAFENMGHLKQITISFATPFMVPKYSIVDFELNEDAHRITWKRMIDDDVCLTVSMTKNRQGQCQLMKVDYTSLTL